MGKRVSAERTVTEIRRKTRRQLSAQEKIRIVLEGLRGEESIAELCRREGIVANLYYHWRKDFLEAGKKLCRLPCRSARNDARQEPPLTTQFEGRTWRGMVSLRPSPAASFDAQMTHRRVRHLRVMASVPLYSSFAKLLADMAGSKHSHCPQRSIGSTTSHAQSQGRSCST